MKTLTLILCTIVTSTFGQKTKTIDIIDLKGIYISAFVKYDDSNVVIDTSYYMAGRNAKYSSLIDIISLKDGDISEIHGLLKKCLEACDEDGGTMIYHGESTIYTTKAKSIMLYGIGDDEDDYVLLNRNQITKLLTKIEELIKK